MDCDNARLFLAYLSPSGKDLDGAEAEELRTHLEQCSACNALAMNARRLDQHVGRAMHDVPVPAGLNARLLQRLADEGGKVRRRWLKRVASLAAAAMLLFGVSYGAYVWYAPRLNAIDVHYARHAGSVGGQNRDHANDVLKRLGARPIAPDFDYQYLVGEPVLAEVPGHEKKVVPKFLFFREVTPARKGEPTKQWAHVYAIPTDKYVGGFTVRPDPTGASNDYHFKADVLRREVVHQGKIYRVDYLVLYEGDGHEWFTEPKDRAE